MHYLHLVITFSLFNLYIAEVYQRGRFLIFSYVLFLMSSEVLDLEDVGGMGGWRVGFREGEWGGEGEMEG